MRYIIKLSTLGELLETVILNLALQPELTLLRYVTSDGEHSLSLSSLLDLTGLEILLTPTCDDIRGAIVFTVPLLPVACMMPLLICEEDVRKPLTYLKKYNCVYY